jgi:hypothetical protein
MNNLADILAQLAETLTASVDQANARADAAQAKLDALARIFVNDNGDDAPPPPSTPVTKIASKGRTKPRAKVVPIAEAPLPTFRGAADAQIVGALTGDWQTARAVHEAIGGDDAPIGCAAVYQRLQTLTKTHPQIVHQHATKNEWRAKQPIKAPVEDVDNALPTLPAIFTGRVPKAAATVAANDTTIATPNDVKKPLLIKGDGLAMMREMADRSVDLVLADLPYGSTKHKFDPKIDAEEWIAEMMRIVTDRGVVVNFCSLAFTHSIMSAGLPFFKERLVWEKPKATGHQLVRHMQAHEDIVVMSKGTIAVTSKRQMVFNPQGVVDKLVKARKNPQSHLNAKP